MQVRQYRWLMWFFLGLVLAACAGGSGSSGFDNFPNSENAAIQAALTDKSCVPFRGLSICPADITESVEPSPLPTLAPSATPTGSTVNPSASATPTPLQTRSASPTASPTATPPVKPARTPRVDTGINDGAVSCAPLAAAGGCILVLPFAPDGFPAATVFRVAVRTVDPLSPWTIGSDLMPSGSPSAPVFDAPVAVAAPPRAPERVQLAVLAFLKPPASVPTTVDTLGDSGADYAFVTAELNLQPAGLQAAP